MTRNMPPVLDPAEKDPPAVIPGRKKLRSVGAVTAGRVLGNACEFVAIALAARILGPAEFGRFSYVLAVAVVSSQFFDLGAARILTIRSSLLIGSMARPEDVGRVYGSLLGLRLAVGTLLLPLLVWMGLLSPWRYLAAGLSLGFLMSVVLCISAIFQSGLEFGNYASSVYISGALRVSGIILLAACGRASLHNLIFLYLAAHVVAILVLLLLIPWQKVHLQGPHNTAVDLIQSFHFGKWLMVAAVFEVAYLRTDVFALRFLGTPHDLGIYAAAFVFAGVFSLIFSSVVAYYVPVMCRAAGEGRIDRLKHYFLESADLLALIGIPAAIGIWAVRPVLFSLLFGEQYRKSSDVWPALAIYSVCMVINHTGAVFFALQKLHIVTLVTLGVFLSNVLFCSLFVPRYGALGAAWAVAIGQVLSLSFCWAVTYRLIGTIPDVVRMAYYLGSSLIVFFIVRAVSIPVPKLNLGIKVFVGIIVYATLLLFYRKRVSLFSKGNPDYAS
jgi:O-antigen/teichoic acid export membrane protein